MTKQKSESYKVPLDTRLHFAHRTKEQSMVPAPSKYFKEKTHRECIEAYLSQKPVSLRTKRH